MSKKRLLFITLIVVLSFGISGCIDLFAVPGIAVSPDGTQLYFLSPLDSETGSLENLQFSVASFNGTATPIMEAFGAFAVNPVTGAVIFSAGLQEGEMDQTFIMRYEDNEARLFIGPEAFEGKNFLATQMKFSPDGSQLAMTGITAPLEGGLDALSSSEEFDPAMLDALDGVVYLVDVDSGALTLISDPAASWANTIDWSPNGQYLAYNGWVDSNGDGVIATGGGFESFMGGAGGATDISQIHIYDVSSGQTTVVAGTGVSYSPTFVSDSQIAYVELDAASMMFGGGNDIKVYDLSSGTSTSVFQAASLIMGMALSPDGSQVAWTQLGGDVSSAMSESGESANPPVELYVSDTAFSAPTKVADLENLFGFVDVPVWMPDGSGVLVASTNFLATLMGTMMSSFGAMAEGFAEEGMEVEGLEEFPTQRVELVDIQTGAVTVVYTGPMINGNFAAGIIGLAGSGDMSSMFGDFGAPAP